MDLTMAIRFAAEFWPNELADTEIGAIVVRMEALAGPPSDAEPVTP